MSRTPKKSRGFQSAQSLFEGYTLQDKGGYITQEFQDYGYRLAVTLDDLAHKSLYIKMAKDIDRGRRERGDEAASHAARAPLEEVAHSP